MDWSKVRLLGNRIVGRVTPLEVSKWILFPSYVPSSTIEIIQSGDPNFRVGDLVICIKTDLHPFSDDIIEAHTIVLFYSSAILALCVGDGIEPQNGFLIMESVEEDRLIKYDGELRDALIWREGTKKVIAFRDAGYIVYYKGQTYRLIREDDVLLEVIDDES